MTWIIRDEPRRRKQVFKQFVSKNVIDWSKENWRLFSFPFLLKNYFLNKHEKVIWSETDSKPLTDTSNKP